MKTNNQYTRILATVKDKTGKDVVVNYCTSIGVASNELVSFYYKYKSKLLEDGHGGSDISIKNSYRAIFIEIDNKVVGHIIFDFIELQKRTWIELSAVDVEYRRRGLYKIMHGFFEEESRKLGAVEISSFIHVTNEGRLRSAESVGFLPKFYRMSKAI